jgi:MarR family transcriptional regulator, 2-MHQ and catechol-resistance regulon repressor
MDPKPSTPDQPGLLARLIQPADRPYIELARELLKASFLFSSHPDRALQAYDLNLAQVDVLRTLAKAPDGTLSCSEIAEKTLITKGGITGIVDRLEARGLVRRVPSRDDRRSVMVRLSAKGVELFGKFYPELARTDRDIFDKAFEPEQMKEFGKLLALLVRSLEAD